MNNIIDQLTRELSTFLESKLCSISTDWWNSCVLSSLSFQQKRLIEEKSISSLRQLDFAALLKIFDRNWSELAFTFQLPAEGHHYLKEMISVRNRWAHSSSSITLKEDLFRDLDTSYRFSSLINADDLLLRYIKDKMDLIFVPLEFSTKTGQEFLEPKIDKVSPATGTKFKLGDIVALKADPKITGAIIQVEEKLPENRYLVFHHQSTQAYYESQLQAFESQSEELQKVGLEEFNSRLSATLINNPSYSTLYSLHSARINFVPYQFRPVLKFIHSDRPRLLIADEVGVGKTIEAGLILRELQARSNISSILILCPKALLTDKKWHREMKRFDENFSQLDGTTLRYCLSEMDLEGTWPLEHEKTIIPFSLFDEELIYGRTNNSRKRSKTKPLLDLDPPPKFDLVIVDEAHYLRNPDTYVHQGVRFFCENAEAVLLLTATPIQMGINDLFVLLNLLRPDLVIDRESFDHMCMPNPFINKAVSIARAGGNNWQEQIREYLTKAAHTPWGNKILEPNPKFNEIISILNKNGLEVEEMVKLIHDIEELHSFSQLINRTRRRDIGSFTVRKPETISIFFTQAQKELHDEILNISAEMLSIIHESNSINFMMTTIRRQVASCLNGLVPMLQDILSKRFDSLSLEDLDPGETDNIKDDALDYIRDSILSLLSKAKKLDNYDPKIEKLIEIIKGKQKLGNNKILIFSGFIHTLKYLRSQLEDLNLRVELMYGKTDDFERANLRYRFSLPKDDPDAVDILLSSEIGSEGLDYQFCDCLINYDIPWNPMRIEQRIGRIDRYGQMSDAVLIYNFITPGTIDADIYNRCLWRIGVFHEAVGGCEEILGEITQALKDVAENFQLTQQEREKRLKQIEENQVREFLEQKELLEKQAELFGIELPAEQIDKDIQSATSYWISPKSLQNLVTTYISRKTESEQFILGEKSPKTLRLNQKTRENLLKDYQDLEQKLKIDRRKTQLFQTWYKWLKQDQALLRITFDDIYANDDRNVVFINQVHPLTKQAAAELEISQPIFTSFSAKSEATEEGSYSFAIYLWQKKGIKSDMVLQPVCRNSSITEKLFELLENGTPENITDVQHPSQSEFDELELIHHSLWQKAKEEYIKFNYSLAQYRKESLNSSHRARISQLEEDLEKATNVNIWRMKTSQINSAKADYEIRMQEINKAETSSDIIVKPVAFGLVNIIK